MSKFEDLNLNPSTHVKSQAWPNVPVATLLEHWVADIIHQPSQNVKFQFSERHCLKIVRQRAIEKDAYCP